MQSHNALVSTLLCISLLSGAAQAEANGSLADMRIETCAKAAVKAATGKSDAGAFTVTNLSTPPRTYTPYLERNLRTQINLTVSGQRFACEVNGRGQVRRLTRLPLAESSLYAAQ